MNCSATTAAGKPCRAHAVHGTDPPLCSAHAGRNAGAGAPHGNQNARKHGYYGQVLTHAEMADMVAAADLTTLEDEVAITRVALRRLLLLLHDADTPPQEIKEIAPLVFDGTGRIARLLQTERLISGEAVDTVFNVLGGALDILTDKFEADL